MRIVCVGGGPGGLFFSLLMKQRHPECDIEVRERNVEGRVQGFGVVLWEDGLDAISSADPASGDAIASNLTRWQGARIVRGDEVLIDDRASGFAVARRELQATLARRARAAGVRLTYGTPVDPHQLPDADLIVVSDGVGSRLREARSMIFGSRSRSSHNRYVWLGTDSYLTSFTFAFLRTEHGWIWCHAYGHGYEPGESTFIVECPPETWVGLGLGTLTTTETLSLLERLFAEHLGNAHLIPPPGSGEQMTWLRFVTLTNERWHDGKAVLLGDAAHTTHFSIGSGTKLALQDAIALADALDTDQDLVAALSLYEKRRRPEIERAQKHAARSLRWFEEFERYSELSLGDFAELLDRRRSSILGLLPPRVYLRMRRLAERGVDITRRIRSGRSDSNEGT